MALDANSQAIIDKAKAQLSWPRQFLNKNGHAIGCLGFLPTCDAFKLTLHRLGRQAVFRSAAEAAAFVQDLDGVRTRWMEGDDVTPTFKDLERVYGVKVQPVLVHDDPAFDYGED